MKNTPHVPLRQIAKSGAARLDLMNRGRGINGRDDRSSGIEIRMADTLVCGFFSFFLQKWCIIERRGENG
jgi:hypothetical protein